MAYISAWLGFHGSRRQDKGFAVPRHVRGSLDILSWKACGRRATNLIWRGVWSVPPFRRADGMQRFIAIWITLALWRILPVAVGQTPIQPPTSAPVKVADVDAMGDVSSDGRYITYVDWATGDLAIRDLISGADRHLTNKGSWIESSEFAEYSVISPDGTSVAYAWAREGGLYDLRLVSTDGSTRKTLYAKGLPYIAPRDWSPDGTKILAWFVKPNGDREIVTVGVTDNSVAVLKKLRQRQLGLLRFDADAQFVAYDLLVNSESGEHDVHAFALADESDQSLVSTQADERLIAWRGGDKVFFSRRDGNRFELYSVGVANGLTKGEPKQVLAGADQHLVESLGLTAKGDYFYGAVDWVNELNLARLDIDDGVLRKGEQFATQVSIASTVEWSPEGRSLAWVVGLNSAFQPTSLVIRNIGSGKEKRLPLRFQGRHGYHPRWISEEELAFHGGDSEGHSTLFRIDAETGNVNETIAVNSTCHDDCAAWYWRNLETGPVVWSTDGTSIQVRKPGVGLRENLHTVSKFEAISRLRLSPDRKWLGFVVMNRENDTTRLIVLPTHEGVQRTLHEFDGIPEGYHRGGTRIVWLPDSRGLILARSSAKTGVPIELWHVPVGDGNPRRLKHSIDYPCLFGLSVHSNGQTIAYTAGRPRRYHIWKIPGFDHVDNRRP